MPLQDMTFRDLLSAIAAKSPTPGGGAVAATTFALAAALAEMVIQYSLGKKSLAAHETLHQDALSGVQRASQRAMELAEADAQAYARLNDLWKLQESDPRRQRELPEAALGAIEPPRQLMNEAGDLLRILKNLVGKTNASLDSDLAIAAVLADAAVRSAAWNVRINLPLLHDERRRTELIDLVGASLEESRASYALIEKHCAAK